MGAFGGAQILERRLTAVDHPLHIDVHHGVLLFQRNGFEIPCVQHAGIVHQHVESAATESGEFLQGTLQPLEVGHIRDVPAAALLTQFSGQRL